MKYNFKLRSREIIDLLLEFSYLAPIFIIPIYFSFFLPTYNVFELSKIFVFKVLIYFLLLLSVLKITFFRTENFLDFNKVKGFVSNYKRYWLPPLIFIVGLGVGLLFSINTAQSFFGSYDRQAGYLSYLFYFVWFVLLFYNIRTLNNHPQNNPDDSNLKLNIHRIFLVAVLASLIISVYGILQRLGIDFLIWPEDPLITKRVFSSFGQPNFLASWLLLVIPLAAYLMSESKKFLNKFFYSLILSAQLICLFLTSSRGALVALVLALFALAAYLLKKKVDQKSKIIFGASFFIIFLLGLFIFSLNSPERMAGLTDFGTGSVGARVNYYFAALEAVSRKPFFGYGLDNGSQALFPNYQSDWGIHANVGVSSDRAHNLILDILLGGGLFNLALFALLYYYFFNLAFKNISQPIFSKQSLALLVGVLAYLISLLFNFSLVSAEIYFFLFLSLLLAINVRQNEDVNLKGALVDNNQLRPISLLGVLAAFAIFVLICFGINYEFRFLKADHYFGAMYNNLNNKQYFTALTLADYVNQEKTNPVNCVYYDRVLADIISDDYSSIDDVLSRMVIKNTLQKIDNRLIENGYLNIFVKGKINLALGNYVDAKKYFQKIIEMSPYWPEAYVQLGEVFVQEKHFKEAIINYQLVLRILPDVNDRRFNEEHRNFLKNYQKNIFKKIADVYIQIYDYEKAESYYQLAYSTNFQDISLFKNIADIYYLRGDFSKAIEYNLRGAKRAPNDFRWPLSLAILYKESGDKIMAHEYFQKAFNLAPEEELLIQLKAEY